MKILVTGGAGFIGSNFIHYWLKNHPKDQIINFDKLTYAGHLTSLRDVEKNKNYKLVKGDICDQKAVHQVVSEVETIVHFAAESHVDRSITDPASFVRTNVLGTQILLEEALKAKVKRFHHVSTDEVFGALELDTKNKFREDTPYAPRSPYAASKAASDHIVRAYNITFGLPISITNCANNFGPYQDAEKFIPRMITNLIDGEPIKLYGDGKYVRDWLYVEDHCIAIDKAIHKGKSGETYLVGGVVQDYSNLDVAHMILKEFSLDESHITFVKDRPGHDRRYAINWNKIKKDLDWCPAHPFKTRLAETVKWYKDNEWWWRPLKKTAEKLYEKTGQT